MPNGIGFVGYTNRQPRKLTASHIMEAVRRACNLRGEGAPTPEEKLIEVLTSLRDYCDSIGEVLATSEVREAVKSDPRQLGGKYPLVRSLQLVALISLCATTAHGTAFNELDAIVWRLERFTAGMCNPLKPQRR